MTTSAPVFEAEFLAALRGLFEERIAFNRLLGLRLGHITADRAEGHLEMRPDLLGHDVHRRLHGGVISAALDGLAGVAVIAAQGGRHMDEPPAARMQRFMKLGTIDLRVDYLRPATGEHFDLQADVLRLGSRVAHVRMTFHERGGALLATGSAAYIVS